MNHNNSKISIIIPAYDVEQYIDAALDSVFAQTASAHEVIVINDGSTDATLAKINQYAKRSDLQLISTENKGQGPARNEGARRASGDYLYFFDSDDLMEPTLIATVQSTIAMHNHPEMILFSGQPFSDSEEDECEQGDFARGFEMADATGEQVLSRMAQVGRDLPAPWLYVVNRQFWSESHACFKAMPHQDTELFPFLLLAAKRVVVIDIVLCFYRKRPMSTMTSPKTDKHLQAYMTIALSGSNLYRNAKGRPAGTRKFLKKRAERYVNRYLKLCAKLEVPADYGAVAAIARDVRSVKTVRRIIQFYAHAAIMRLLPSANSRLV